ncbi:MAG: hypothetical protein IJY99_00365 [Alphaproteobacteria bacterium]|nr:hypothetical protein [Alphaproteobacteria bacterium]
MGGNEIKGMLVLLAMVVVGGFIRFLYQYSTIETQRITIQKLKFGADNSKAQYMIYTKDGQVIRNSNLLFFGKFKSDEIFAKLKVGKSYMVKTCGIRVPFLGWYKNVITITEIKSSVRKKTGKKSKK